MSCRFISQIRIAMNFLTAVLLFPLVLILAAFKKVIHEERTWKGALSQSFKDWMGSRMQDLLFVLATSIIVSIPVCLLLKNLGVPENTLSVLGWIIVILVVLVILINCNLNPLIVCLFFICSRCQRQMLYPYSIKLSIIYQINNSTYMIQICM